MLPEKNDSFVEACEALFLTAVEKIDRRTYYPSIHVYCLPVCDYVCSASNEKGHLWLKYGLAF